MATLLRKEPKPEPPKPEAFFIRHPPTLLLRREREQITYEEVSTSDRKPNTPIEGHPLASSAGSFKDDPFWESMMSAIESNRRELDAEYNVPE